jgi:hypothetical protein
MARKMNFRILRRYYWEEKIKDQKPFFLGNKLMNLSVGFSAPENSVYYDMKYTVLEQ